MSDSGKITYVSLTEAKQRLGELVKRASYGGETVVLEFRGKAVATIMGYDEYSRFAMEDTGEMDREVSAVREAAVAYRTGTGREERRRVDEVLARMRASRNEIAARRGSRLPDSAELLREAREERDDQLSGLP